MIQKSNQRCGWLLPGWRPRPIGRKRNLKNHIPKEDNSKGLPQQIKKGA